MAGLAKTAKFMLGTATVMIGPQNALFDLNPTEHSIGLVKNFSITAEPGYTELTQGVKNSIVASVLTSNPVRASMEVYEFTSKTLGYGLGLDGSTFSPTTINSTVATAIDGTPTAVTTVSVVSGTGFAANDYIMIQEGTDDEAMVRKVTAVTGNDLTITPGIKRDFAVGSTVRKVNVVGVGSKSEQPFLAAKIVGTLADNSEVVILIPKMRIVRGFQMAFSSDNFGNLPYEFTVYDLVPTDPNYTEFGGDQARIFTAA